MPPTNIGDVCRPHLVRSINDQSLEQVWVLLLPWISQARAPLGVDASIPISLINLETFLWFTDWPWLLSHTVMRLMP